MRDGTVPKYSPGPYGEDIGEDRWEACKWGSGGIDKADGSDSAHGGEWGGRSR